jgi:holo-[acyl-carrier protein] synthase
VTILAHGVDIVSVARLARSLEQHGDRFLARVFTPAEAAYAASSKRRDQHLAGRFAAKEAAMKALGTGWRSGIAWTDFEVALEPSGRPFLRVTGEGARISDRMGVAEWRLSISHTDELALASVIAVGR